MPATFIEETAVAIITPTSNATPVPTPTQTAVATVTASDTPAPTVTATMVATTTPTNTQIPTNTPRPTLTQTPQPTATRANTAIGVLQSLDDGEEVTVIGRVVATASFSHGFKFTLDDGTGRVVLLLWHNVYDDCWDAPKLNMGATVRATGQVSRFEGELQIAPAWGGGVKVTMPGGPFAPLRDIEALAAHLGERVMIVGEIGRMEAINSGVKLFISDDTGEVAVFIWNNLLERVPNQQALGVAGTRVRVVGWVQEFRGNGEVVPMLPYDVEVLP